MADGTTDGERVEFETVAAALRDCPPVRDACAGPYRSGTGRMRRAAYVVLDPDHDRTVDPVGPLTAHLTRALPDGSVPDRIIVVDGLPRDAHGSVDRSRLPVPTGIRPDLARPFQEPATRLERRIARVWAQVLDLDEVGRDDDFHDLGGQSLAKLAIWFRLAEQLGLDYDDELLQRIVLHGDTVANTAREAVAGGLRHG